MDSQTYHVMRLVMSDTSTYCPSVSVLVSVLNKDMYALFKTSKERTDIAYENVWHRAHLRGLMGCRVFTKYDLVARMLEISASVGWYASCHPLMRGVPYHINIGEIDRICARIEDYGRVVYPLALKYQKENILRFIASNPDINF